MADDDGSPRVPEAPEKPRPSRGPGLGTNQETARRHNLGTVLRHLHRSAELSRSELTRRTWLNRSTIADLTAELEALGITERTKLPAEHAGAGRPSAGVRIVDDGPYVVAVDLAVDHVTVARVGLGGRVHGRTRGDLDPSPGPRSVASTVSDLVRDLVAGAPPSCPFVAIGVAVPGLVRRTDGLVRLAPNLGWRDVGLADLLLDELGLDVPVVVGNEADLGALVEHERGAGAGVDDLVYISGQVGVGAGIIAGGRPLGGLGGYAGEVGHLQIDPSGRACHCGSVGCWETLVGGHAIAAATGCPPGDVPRLSHHLDGLTVVPPALRRIADDIGRGLGSIANVLNPQLILLGGYFSSLYPHVRQEVVSGFSRVALPMVLEGTTLTAPSLEGDAVLLGAAEVALEAMFTDPAGSVSRAVRDAPTRLGR